ncbi:MAG: DNA polymerase, partial [Actinomycetales bacterium]
GVDLTSSIQLFEKLEIKALRDRVKSLVEGEPKKVFREKVIKTQFKEVSNHELVEFIADSEKVSAVIEEGRLKVGLENGSAFVTDIAPGLLAGKKVITHRGKELIKSRLGGIVVFDLEIAAYLINPGTRDLELDELSAKFLGTIPVASDLDLFASKHSAEVVLDMLKLALVLTEEMKSRELYSLFEKLEMPTMELLANMEESGIAVDIEVLEDLRGQFQRIEDAETRAAHKEAGEEFNVSSPKQLQTILFEKLKLPKTKRIKTGFSTDAESLEWLFAATKHQVLGNILKIREFSKLRTTVEGLLSSVQDDSRIHTTFQQTVTATGRLSSINPNLQNIPIRSEEGRRIRGAFIAQSPFVELMTADYSQIEMRIMAHLSEDAGLLKAFAEGEDLHSTVAAQVFGVPTEKVDSDMRRQIKAMSYGLAYGLSSFGLSQQLDIPPNEASALMDRYFERFGGIQKYLKEVVRIAREKGYTETILGRRRYLPDLNHENRQRREVAERMALNAPIQGSAADIIKEAMLRVNSAIQKARLKSRLLLQVHDELIFEVAPNERTTLEKLVRAEMGSAFPLKAPLDVNIGFGRSWHEAAH